MVVTMGHGRTNVVGGDDDDDDGTQQQKQLLFLYRPDEWAKSSYAKKKQSVQKDESAAGRRPYRCTKCDKAYKSRRTLFRHRKTHAAATTAADRGPLQNRYGVNGRTFACTECARIYRSDRTLKRHALFAHGKGRRRFECDACDKSFASNYALRRHLVVQAGCAGKPCERCTNVSCKDDRKSVILRRVFTYVLSRAVDTR